MLSSGLKPPPPLVQRIGPSHVFRAPIPSCGAFFQKSSFHAESSHFCFIPITSLLHPRAIIPHTQGRKGGTQRGEANFLSGGGLSAGLHAAARRKRIGANRIRGRRFKQPAADDASAAGQLLFPELSDTDITGIRIHANDDCEFDFSVRGELSVNGKRPMKRFFPRWSIS